MAQAALVLDTNVVLNWLFFQHPPTLAVIHSLLPTYQWVSSPWMQREAQRVAHSAHLAKYASPAAFERLSAGFAQHACMVDAAHCEPAMPAPPLLKCRDPDDQAFLDLARHTQAPLLLSLDRDLLKLRKRAGQLGLQIVAPDAWRGV